MSRGAGAPAPRDGAVPAAASPPASPGSGSTVSGSTGASDGPVLPEQTRDDTDEGWGGRDREDWPGDDDERYLRDRPPHWE